MSALDLLVLALATWRAAYFVAKEAGPWSVMARLRTRFGGLTACIYCASVYAALAVYGIYLVIQWPVYVVAVSGLAMMLYRYTGGVHSD